jgi:hypothetical protein
MKNQHRSKSILHYISTKECTILVFISFGITFVEVLHDIKLSYGKRWHEHIF